LPLPALGEDGTGRRGLAPCGIGPPGGIGASLFQHGLLDPAHLFPVQRDDLRPVVRDELDDVPRLLLPVLAVDPVPFIPDAGPLLRELEGM